MDSSFAVDALLRVRDRPHFISNRVDPRLKYRGREPAPFTPVLDLAAFRAGPIDGRGINDS